MDYAVVAFGDSPGMATELAALVISGQKRATCSLVRDYADVPATLPKVGDLLSSLMATASLSASGRQPKSRSNRSCGR